MNKDDSNTLRIGTELVEIKAPPAVAEQKGNEALLVEGASRDQVAQYLRGLMPQLDDAILAAIIPWFYDKLRSRGSRKVYSGDLARFWGLMRNLGFSELEVTDDHVKMFKGLLLDSGDYEDATVSRYLTVIRRTYHYLATHNLVPWDVARNIQAIEGPTIEKNSTPALSSEEASKFLSAIETHTLKGKRDLAMMWTYVVTACRVSAIIDARVGELVYENNAYRLQVKEKGSRKTQKVLLEAAPAVLRYMEAAGIEDDREGPLFRPMTRDGLGVERRKMSRRTPLRLVKTYCRRAGIQAERLNRRGISPHSLRKSAINDAISNGATMEQVQALAGHRSIMTTRLYYVQKDEDAEIAARRIHIRPVARG